jgi:hypothetical protein
MADRPRAALSLQQSSRLRSDRDPPPNGGTIAFISWNRLTEELRGAGEFRPTETVTCFEITDDGLNIFLERA